MVNTQNSKADIDEKEHSKQVDKAIKKYGRSLWWTNNKDGLIAKIIMISMITVFIIYMIIAISQGWDIRFN